jgi:tripartite-type tricarboxylate transporter receptor subunit TctC
MMSNTHTVNETLIPKKPFDLMRDLAPITGVNYSDLLMVIHPSVPANNLKEFIALAKAKPKELNYASSGPGTPYHMAGELFKAMAGVDIVHVPYKGSDGARTGILGGQVQMMIDAITTMAPNVRGGKLKALGTTGKTRSSVLPDVPTVAEAGVPGYEAGNLARPDGAGGHSAPGPRAAERGDQQDHQCGRRSRELDQARCDADGDVDRRLRQIPARGNREVGRCR